MRLRAMAFLLTCAVGAFSWQESFTRLNLDREAFEKAVRDYAYDAVNRDGSFEIPPLRSVKILLGMNDAARAGLVRECGLAAKAFVVSPAFRAGYDAYIKNAYRAVDHGITATASNPEASNRQGGAAAPQAPGNNMMRDMYRKGVVERLPSVGKYDKDTIGMMAGVDKGLMDTSNPSTPAEKAAVVKAKAMLEEAAKLAAADIAKAREIYKAALMTAAGLQDEAQAKASEDDDRRKEEQQNYDRMRLQPNLKKKLVAFVSIVKTVDFNAATTMKDGKRIFVNRAYEGRDDFWKMLYRLGPGGANAAAQIAQQWAAEL